MQMVLSWMGVSRIKVISTNIKKFHFTWRQCTHTENLLFATASVLLQGRPIHAFARAAVIKCHSLAGCRDRDLFIYYFSILEPRSLRSRCQWGWFLARPLLLAHTRLSCLRMLTISFCSRVYALISSSKDNNHSGLGLTQITSFQHNDSLKGVISRCSDILRYWPVGLEELQTSIVWLTPILLCCKLETRKRKGIMNIRMHLRTIRLGKMITTRKEYICYASVAQRDDYS